MVMEGLADGRLSDRLGEEAYRFMELAGLMPISQRGYPWFPDHAVIKGRGDPCSVWLTGAYSAPRFTLPGVLVTPLRIYLRDEDAYVAPVDDFQPYWSGPLRVHGLGDPLPDPRVWRDVSVFEIACALGQHGHIGSLRCADPCLDDGALRRHPGNQGFAVEGTVQAYYWHHRGGIVLDRHGSDPFHRRAFILRQRSGDPFPFKDLRREAA